MPPVDEAFVSDRIEDVVAQIGRENAAARAQLRAALVKLEPERAR